MLDIHLYRAPGERNHGRDVVRAIRDLRLRPDLFRSNPLTEDIWIVTLNFVRDHIPHAMAGTGLLGFITLWLKRKNGRGIEMQRKGLKIRTPTSKELEKTLKVLDRYDMLHISINGAKRVRKAPPKQKHKTQATRPRKVK